MRWPGLSLRVRAPHFLCGPLRGSAGTSNGVNASAAAPALANGFANAIGTANGFVTALASAAAGAFADANAVVTVNGPKRPHSKEQSCESS